MSDNERRAMLSTPGSAKKPTKKKTQNSKYMRESDPHDFGRILKKYHNRPSLTCNSLPRYRTGVNSAIWFSHRRRNLAQGHPTALFPMYCNSPLRASNLSGKLQLRREAVADSARYYPYIHIRDVDWLKATLVLTPVEGPQAEDGPVEPFTRWQDGSGPLLVITVSRRARAAQDQLANSLRDDAKDRDFRGRF